MTKLAAELMVAEYGDAYGIRFMIDRCGLLTGPWQMAKADQGVVAFWVAAHCLNRGLKYIGFGGNGQAGARFPAHRRFLRPGARPDRQLRRLCRAALECGRRREEQRLAAAKRRSSAGKSRAVRWRWLRPMRTGRSDLRFYITDHRAVSAVRGWSPQRDARRTIGDIAGWIDGEEHRCARCSWDSGTSQTSGDSYCVATWPRPGVRAATISPMMRGRSYSSFHLGKCW